RTCMKIAVSQFNSFLSAARPKDRQRIERRVGRRQRMQIVALSVGSGGSGSVGIKVDCCARHCCGSARNRESHPSTVSCWNELFEAGGCARETTRNRSTQLAGV